MNITLVMLLVRICLYIYIAYLFIKFIYKLIRAGIKHIKTESPIIPDTFDDDVATKSLDVNKEKVSEGHTTVSDTCMDAVFCGCATFIIILGIIIVTFILTRW